MDSNGPVRRPFGAVLTAMVTPFTADGAVDFDAAQKLARHLVDQGHDGLVINGTTGEAPTTTDAEKSDLIRAVRQAVGSDVVLIGGAGGNDTAHAVEQAAQVAAAGADGLLVVTPYYSKPPQAGVVAHFRAVADVTELPVLLYDIPGRTGTPISTESLLRLAEHPRIVAVKDAKGDMFEASRVLAVTDLAWYSGADEDNLLHLVQGAGGVVSVVGHFAGPRLAELCAAVDAGDLPAARAAQTSLIAVIDTVMRRTQGAIAVKAGLHALGLLPNRDVRLPLVAGDDDLAQAVRQAALDLVQPL